MKSLEATNYSDQNNLMFSDHIEPGLSRFFFLGDKHKEQLIVVNSCFHCPCLLWDDEKDNYYCAFRKYYGNPEYAIPEYTVMNGIDINCPLPKEPR